MDLPVVTPELTPDTRSANLMSQQDITDHIREFQSFAGLPQTGELDQETVRMMNRPRCGVRDMASSSSGREKRYALQGSRWKVKNLTYRISKYPSTSKMSQSDVDTEIARALDVSPLL